MQAKLNEIIAIPKVGVVKMVLATLKEEATRVVDLVEVVRASPPASTVFAKFFFPNEGVFAEEAAFAYGDLLGRLGEPLRDLIASVSPDTMDEQAAGVMENALHAAFPEPPAALELLVQAIGKQISDTCERTPVRC